MVHVVPTFGWTLNRAPGGALIESNRPGSTLRVYLRRPWWTSGAGEKLGVVLFPGGVNGTHTKVPDDLVPYATQWGSDPAYGGFPLPAPLPRFASFPEASSTARGLFLDELPHRPGATDRLFDVAVHDVGFDAEQDLWYCDIRFDAGAAYQPFVRLGLARYQAQALAGPTDDMHLSRVIMTEFVQLAPDRFATVVFQTSRKFTVSLFGQTYDSTAAGSGPGDDATDRRLREEQLALLGRGGDHRQRHRIVRRLHGVGDTHDHVIERGGAVRRDVADQRDDLVVRAFERLDLLDRRAERSPATDRHHDRVHRLQPLLHVGRGGAGGAGADRLRGRIGRYDLAHLQLEALGEPRGKLHAARDRVVEPDLDQPLRDRHRHEPLRRLARDAGFCAISSCVLPAT